MTVPLTTPPTRRPIGSDSSYAREKFNDAIGNLNQAVLSLQSLSFGNLANGQPTGSLNTFLAQGTSGAANTPFTINHPLGQIPNGAILVQSNIAAILYGSAATEGWTSTQISVLLNQASVDYVILIL